MHIDDDPGDLLGSSGQGPGVGEDPSRWPTGRLVSAVARRAERELDARLVGHGLSHATMPILATLLPWPRSQRQIAALIGITEQTLSRHIVALERQGHVRRSTDATDGRRRLVELTEHGRATMTDVVPRLREATAGERALDAGETAALRTLLLKMVSATERDDQD
ncbi:MarR family winged helix-turn-helix transcriptional regulator [Georgenia sp. Z1344]|uniref:MarR family winged helix-turn-helix transcriptional regulator n=1 Tax=Georgenia sp. Z1344 TaxID=3416706 RepID=UPI003CF99933